MMSRKWTSGWAGWGVAVVVLVAGPWVSGAAGQSFTDGERRGELSRQEVAEHAAEIDELVNRGLAENNERPNAYLRDEAFVRRIHLDIAGTIPTYERAKRFIESRSTIKREQLIDELLDSSGYVSHSFNYFADLLRITSRLNNDAGGRSYIAWVKEALERNLPYDRFVYELITATGRPAETGPAGYYIRDSGMPLDNTSNTVRVFLGTSIGCAMCHDHPFDEWTQVEFYEMSAFTYGVRTREQDETVRRLNRLAERFGGEDREDQRMANTLRGVARAWAYNVGDAEAQVRLPHDYKYPDAAPGELVEPFAIFGETPEPEEGETLREAYARWMTSKENPRFAKVIANRLWKRAFGVGVIEPVDELAGHTGAANPELMAYLERLVKDLDFDMKQFLRVVYNTRAYQREASRQELDPDEPYHFPGPVLRRMTAEQVWDSFVTLAVPDADSRARPPGSYGYVEADLSGMSDEELLDYARDRMRGGGGMMMMGGGGAYAQMARASELPSPAPPGHFLWRFGQSDRELIENASARPTATQVLTLLNGPIDRILLQDESVLHTNVRRARNQAEKIEVIWLSILGRKPTRPERTMATREVAETGDEAFDNLVWALLNTREFLFIQ